MSIRCWKTSLGAALVVCFCEAAALSQEVGDTVHAVQSADLKVQEAVVAKVAVGDALTVRKVAGRWLWVQTATGQRGWVLKDQVEVTVRPLPAATTGKSGNDAPAPQPVRVREPAAARREVKPVAGTDSNSPWLGAIGVLAGQNVYTSYAYIGAIADGYGQKTYDAAHVQQLMNEVAGMLAVARKNMESVRDTATVEQDRAAIDDVISILDLLSEEATSLAKYTKSGAEADLQAYDQARTTVWPKVQAMLDLE
ncbi:MAG: hypothetical protein U0992_18785 [Planctomycetaceae bacterium]